MQAADELLARFRVDQSERIDVFGVCEQADLWLTFRPLDRLLGAYVPLGSGGVIVTTLRSVAVQRYTVAHELGHWVLEHNALALDDEQQVYGSTHDEREQLAQLFADYVLLPPPLSYEILSRLGVDSQGGVSPQLAYGFAREAGVSYEAAVRHLANLEVISGSEVRVLLKARPLAIKTNLARGNPPLNARADVWLIDERWNAASLQINPDDEVLLQLPENRTTGYRWQSRDELAERDQLTGLEPPPPFSDRGLPIGMSGSSDFAAQVPSATRAEVASASQAVIPSLGLPDQGVGSIRPTEPLVVVRDEYAASWTTARTPVEITAARSKLVSGIARGETELDARTALRGRAHGQRHLTHIGGTGRRYLTLRAQHPAHVSINLTYASQFDPSSPVAGNFVLDVTIESPRRVMSIQQLFGSGETLVAGADGS
jgi:predicted secreted protein